MREVFKDFICVQTGSDSTFEIEMIQSLWSGYGSIVRYGLEGSIHKTIIVKHIKLPEVEKHPRGWNTNISHERKIKSYQVESYWYEHYAEKLKTTRIPKCFGVKKIGDEVCILLEDLDQAGYPIRRNQISDLELKHCIEWLAKFHATHLHIAPVGLWKVGTYWHLETRSEELEVLEDLDLKKASKKIDQILNESPFQTLVHGDAKLANFCFSKAGNVAAVDFQYVGGGVGVKDLAYFVGSCFYEEDCENNEEYILELYFKALKSAVGNSGIDFEALEKNWRELYPVAWTDFHRFLKGWSPGHWKINSYSERITRETLKKIN
ncbi:oxidoreductase family protein [Flavicella marina]|uniref:oxidoreductase family protein n=1 Tax=Flavicella marina TaxID=1475951 RepID=UPI001263F5CB|nr:oxidoreductase family protein [Flavicella marina]